MQDPSGCLRWSVIAIALLAACAPPRSSVRLGSLTPSHRSLDYDPGIVSWKLANQLTVAMLPDTRVNLVTVEVRYRVGAAEDPPGKTGLAHLVEHLLFARRRSPGGPEIADELSAAALRYNASTNWDSTHYIAVGLAARLDELLAIEAARMAGGCAGIDEAALARERAIVFEELAQRDAGDVNEPLQQAVFGAGHVYGHSVGGRDVASLTLADVCQFIDAYYAPSRAILVVSGRIPASAVHAIATRFGPIARRATGSHTEPAAIAWTGQASELTVAVDDPEVLVMFPAAPWGDREAIYERLVDRVILARLEQEARRSPWLLGVSLGHLGGDRGGARVFSLRLGDAARAGDAVTALYAAARDLPGIDDDDLILGLGSARQSELLGAFESIDTRGTWCADYLQLTRHGKFHLRELAELQQLDAALLRERAGRLTRDASRVVVLRPSHTRARARDAAFTASAQIDVPVWRATVDLAEAARPIALAAEPRTTALTERWLANGLHVVMLPTSPQPIFTARLVFPFTSAGAPGASLAAAQLLSHDRQAWFTPRESRAVGWVMRLGSPVSWSVGDHTSFSVHGSSMYADAHLWRLYWLLTNGRYEPADVAHLEDIAARDAAHRERSRAGRTALREALFGPDHPYAIDLRLAIARRTGSLRAADLDRYRDTYYRANGATLILVGNFDPAAMMTQVTELFGAWPAGPPPAIAPLPPIQPLPGPTWIADVDPEALQLRVDLAFAATSPRSSRSSRLIVAEMLRDRVERVRSRLGASYGISVRYTSNAAGDVLNVQGLVDAGRAGEALRAILASLDGLRRSDDRFAADFVRARRAALAHALGDPVRSSAAADQLEYAAANHLPIDAFRALPAEIAATTVDAARTAIAQDLQPSRMALMLAGRATDTQAAFAEAGITGVKIVTEQPAQR